MAMWIALIASFLAGFLSFALILVSTALFFFHRLFLRPLHRRNISSAAARSSNSDLAPFASYSSDSSSSSSHRIFLQGHLWIAALPSSISKKDATKREKISKDHKKKKDGTDDIFDARPSRRFAKIDNSVLSLVAEDGTEESADLKGCSIHAVSAGKEASRKWAKKYPIQIECFNQQIFLGSSLCLLYFETTWQKETWCQILRAASRWTTEKEDWYITCKREFHEYSLQLDKAYPSFCKLTQNKDENLEHKNNASQENVEETGNLSRRQRLWRKIAKKGSWRGVGAIQKENSGSKDVKIKLLESTSLSEDLDHQSSLGSQSVIEGSSNHGIVGSGNLIQVFEKSYGSMCLEQVDSHESGVLARDQGAICWNILCSRLFFDAYRSKQFRELCLRLVQKQLAKIVTPAYMGKINCADLDLGTQPPYFQSFHVLPKDSGFIWSFDSAIEYFGGAVIKIETNINARDFMSQESAENHSIEHTLSDEDILLGFDSIQKRNAKDNKISSNTTAQSSKGGWRAVFTRVADQVSMMPITLSLRLVSLKGTVRVRIKPPPTDSIWFGFTSMPSIDLQPEPSIGDHKITTGPFVTFITNKIKALIQDTYVLPNCEGIWVPWMISETNDWVPQADMPAPWNSQTDISSPDYSLPREEIKDTTLKRTPTGSTNDVTILKQISSNDDTLLTRAPSTERISFSDDAVLKHPEVISYNDSLEKDASSKETVSYNDAILKDAISGGKLMTISDELNAPLLQKSKSLSESESGSPARSESSSSIKSSTIDDKGNRSSRRAKVLNLGKKVTGKLDEKRRMVVEKMREGLEKYENSVKAARED